MRFEFVSHQIVLEEGEVAAGRGFAWTVPLRMNAADGVPAVKAGQLELLISNCSVRLLSTKVVYRIPILRLTTEISVKEIVAGVTRIEIGFHALVRIEGIDRNGESLTTKHLLGVALPNLMSVEASGPANTPLYVLLPPGEYLAYLAGTHPLQVPFVVSEHEGQTKNVRLSDVHVERPAR